MKSQRWNKKFHNGKFFGLYLSRSRLMIRCGIPSCLWFLTLFLCFSHSHIFIHWYLMVVHFWVSAWVVIFAYVWKGTRRDTTRQKINIITSSIFCDNLYDFEGESTNITITSWCFIWNIMHIKCVFFSLFHFQCRWCHPRDSTNWFHTLHWVALN